MAIREPFRDAFLRQGLHDDTEMAKALKATSIKIIDYCTDSGLPLQQQAMIQALKASGLNASMLSNPFKWHAITDPCPIAAGSPAGSARHHTGTPEIKNQFNHEMWEVIHGAPEQAEVIISNLRALNEAIAQNSRAEMIIIIDAAATPSTNVVEHMANIIANFLVNEELHHCNCLALSYSPYFGPFERVFRARHPLVTNSESYDEHFSILRMGMESPRVGYWCYNWKGQGSQAMVYRRCFAHRLLDQQVCEPWDEHVLSLCTDIRLKSNKKQHIQQNMTIRIWFVWLPHQCSHTTLQVDIAIYSTTWAFQCMVATTSVFTSQTIMVL